MTGVGFELTEFQPRYFGLTCRIQDNQRSRGLSSKFLPASAKFVFRLEMTPSLLAFRVQKFVSQGSCIIGL
jgi:hypothetical protein